MEGRIYYLGGGRKVSFTAEPERDRQRRRGTTPLVRRAHACEGRTLHHVSAADHRLQSPNRPPKTIPLRHRMPTRALRDMGFGGRSRELRWSDVNYTDD